MTEDREQQDTRERSEGATRRGATGHGFLDLEISRMLAGDASRLARRAFADLLAEEIKGRLREKMGGRIEALARYAADELMADIEANLAIEQRIEQRQERRERSAERLREILGGEEP